MCVPNLVPIGPETATCIRFERYTHRHTLSYIDIDKECGCNDDVKPGCIGI